MPLAPADVQADFDKVYQRITAATGSSNPSDYTRVQTEITNLKHTVQNYGTQGNAIGNAISLLTDAFNWVQPTSHTLGQCKGSVDLAHAQIPTL